VWSVAGYGCLKGRLRVSISEALEGFLLRYGVAERACTVTLMECLRVDFDM
jgi:hypothetical protein